MLSFKYYNILEESFKDAKKKWLESGIESVEIDKAIDLFKLLKDQNVISDVERKDIGYWMKLPFSDFSTFLVSMNKLKHKKEFVGSFHDETEVIENTDEFIILVPKTYRASRKFGSSEWCIAYGERYWNSYVHNDGLTPHFIIFKSPDEFMKDNNLDKIAVMVGMGDRVQSMWDSSDAQIYYYSEYTENREGMDGEDDYEVEITLNDILKEWYEIDVDEFTSKLEETYVEFITHETIDKVVEKLLELPKDYSQENANSVYDSDKSVFEPIVQYYIENPGDVDNQVTVGDFVEYLHTKVELWNEERVIRVRVEPFLDTIPNKRVEIPVTILLKDVCKEVEEELDRLVDDNDFLYTFT